MEDSALRRVLEDLRDGQRSVHDVLTELRRHGLSEVGDFALLDLGRHRRKGVPEIVFAAGKSADQLVAIVAAFLEHADSVVCSKTSLEQRDAVAASGLGEPEFDVRSGVLVVRRRGATRPEPSGVVGVLAAGTADVGVAEEAAAVCREMGVGVMTAYDVGVAGVHRLAAPLGEMVDAGAAAVVVAAGMEGALPSVVSGLVPVPVIGLPTSTGYGMGGRGEAALLAMLQSCSPGLVVVNIDNGVGAGATAALIARGARP
jgi:NCAIR mutase (PurE)-related protein